MYETKEEITNRIGQELQLEKKLEERRKVVMSYFFELTGIPMTLEQFEKYNKIFNNAQSGYNIKSFIRDENIKLDNSISNLTLKEFVNKFDSISV